MDSSGPQIWMLAHVSKYTIDTRIQGWLKPSNLGLNQTHLTISTHLKYFRHWHCCITKSLLVPDVWDTEIWIDHDCPCIGLLRRLFIRPLVWAFARWLHRSELSVCWWICATWFDRVGTLVNGNRWSDMDSNWVCYWQWKNTNLWMQYASWKDTLFSWYSVVWGFCSKVSSQLDIIVCRISLSAFCVCWIHNMYCSQCKTQSLGLQRRDSM